MVIEWNSCYKSETFENVFRKIYEQYGYIYGYQGAMRIEVEHQHKIYDLFDIRTGEELYIPITTDIDMAGYFSNSICMTEQNFESIKPILSYCKEWELNNKEAFLCYLAREYGLTRREQDGLPSYRKFDKEKLNTVIEEIQQINERVLQIQNEIYKEE